jgi:uncharacterized protein (TIGR03437 family)
LNAPSTGSAAAIQSGGVVTASAFGGFRNAAPGPWIEIYGSGPATDTRSWATADFSGSNAPTSLNGTSVTIGGQRAFVSYLSPGQVNVRVPSNLGSGTQNVVVSTPNGDTASVPPTLAPTILACSRRRPSRSTDGSTWWRSIWTGRMCCRRV